MAAFLILAPFGIFAIFTWVTSASISLFAGAAAALATVIYDLSRGKQTKLLASGSMILFAALGCYVTLVNSGLGTPIVRLMVDLGVLAISLLSTPASVGADRLWRTSTPRRRTSRHRQRLHVTGWRRRWKL